MKKHYLLGVILLSVGLTGCQEQSAKKPATPAKIKVSETFESAKSTDTVTTTAATATKTKPSEKNKGDSAIENPHWTATQKRELADFMSSWGAEMGQAYQAYDPTNNGDFYGIKFPADLLNGSRTVKVDGQAAEFKWSAAGEKTSGYQVVAAYSDTETANYAAKHFYLFTLSAGQPKVLVTMQNQGNEDNSIIFKETENQALKNGFAQIVGGKQPAELQTSQAKGAPITTMEEADRLIRKGNISDYHDQPYVFSSEAQADGSYVLTIASGAKGQDIFTLTPNHDGTVRIAVQYGSGEGGKFTLFPDQAKYGPTEVTVTR